MYFCHQFIYDQFYTGIFNIEIAINSGNRYGANVGIIPILNSPTSVPLKPDTNSIMAFRSEMIFLAWRSMD
jgi:hypothetical protein